MNLGGAVPELEETSAIPDVAREFTILDYFVKTLSHTGVLSNEGQVDISALTNSIAGRAAKD